MVGIGIKFTTPIRVLTSAVKVFESGNKKEADFQGVDLYDYADNYFDLKESLENLFKREVDDLTHPI